MRKSFTLKFFLLFIILITCKPVIYAQYCMTAWKYEIPIIITNTTFAKLNDYQVKLTVNTSSAISAGKMSSTGDDIRFADSATCTNIPYWIESGINTSSTVIWIKLPVLPASSSKVIKMLYGNSSAAAASNGDSTFLIFDNFSGSKLDSTKWNTYGTNSTYSTSNGILTLVAGANSNIGSRIFVSSKTLNSPIIVEANITSINGYYTHLGTLNASGFSGYTLFYADNSAGSNAGMHTGQSYSNGPSFSTNFISSNSNPGTVKGIWSTTWSSTSSLSGSWPGGAFSNTVSGFNLNSTVQLTFGLDWTSIASVSFDWVRAREYAASEPTIQMGTEVHNHNAGIETETEYSDIKVYPNPATDKIYISQANNMNEIESIYILDINGRILQRINAYGLINNIEIPLKGLRNGIYFLKINELKAVYIKKFIVDQQ